MLKQQQQQPPPASLGVAFFALLKGIHNFVMKYVTHSRRQLYIGLISINIQCDVVSHV